MIDSCFVQKLCGYYNRNQYEKTESSIFIQNIIEKKIHFLDEQMFCTTHTHVKSMFLLNCKMINSVSLFFFPISEPVCDEYVFIFLNQNEIDKIIKPEVIYIVIVSSQYQ